MAITYSDQAIAALLQERKPLPGDWRNRARLKPKRGHSEQQLDLIGDANSEFRIILRRSGINRLDFSVILAVRVPGSSQWFRLLRCNGRHEHTNRIESVTFYDFHIHVATERYQDFGTREDTYAEPTDRYDDFDGALRCLIDEANFSEPLGSQIILFEEG